MTNNFIPHTRLSGDPAARLVCLPYAGGGSAVYFRWRSFFPHSIDLLPICLAGREGRVEQPPATDLIVVAREIAGELQPCLDRPWAIVGHSMGAWLAMEVLRELRRQDAPPPLLFVVAASRAPHVAESLRDSENAVSERRPHAGRPVPLLHTLPDDEFLSAIRERYDGIPPSVRGNPELLRLLLPTLRADIQMAETYHYAEEAPLETEIFALGGTDDPAVSPSDLAEWRRHTTNKFSSRFVPGRHFFLFRGAGSRDDHAEGVATYEARPSPALAMIIAKIEQLIPLGRLEPNET